MRPTNTHVVLYLEFLSGYDSPFDFIEGQFKLKAVNRCLEEESQNFVPAAFECCPRQQ